jgi:pseudouridine-5'-phosphate glycosidase
MTLSRTPVTVVCSGAKSILDLARTMEWLESLGVPVVGYGTDKLPAFYLRESTIGLDYAIEDVGALARMVRLHRELSNGGIVVANPIPLEAAIDAQTLEGWTHCAMARAEHEGVSGKAITPFLLKTVAELSEGATLAANASLLLDNTRVASELAAELCRSAQRALTTV